MVELIDEQEAQLLSDLENDESEVYEEVSDEEDNE